jgi:hypothetical protein
MSKGSDTSKSTEKSKQAEVPKKTVTLKLGPAPATQASVSTAGVVETARGDHWICNCVRNEKLIKLFNV